MFLNDQETKVDLLYYEAIAKTVVELIRERPETPITIGVHGDWGAGKSSVLKMTDAELAADKRVLCLWFNGWTFEGFEDAKAVVIETIVEELRRARPGVTKVADAARKVLKRIDWLKLARKAGGFAFTLATGIPTLDQLTGLAGLATSLFSKSKELVSAEDIKSFAENAGDYLKKADESDHLSEQVHAFRKEFQELLEAADIDKLVVFVDDLDRCLPETAIATLEATGVAVCTDTLAVVAWVNPLAQIKFATPPFQRVERHQCANNPSWQDCECRRWFDPESGGPWGKRETAAHHPLCIFDPGAKPRWREIETRGRRQG